MVDYFRPYDPAFVADPYPVYARLRAEDPALRSEELGLVLFSRHADILSLLRDRRLGRAFESDPPAGAAHPDKSQLPHYRRYVADNLLEHEGQTHSRLRGILFEALNPARILSLKPKIESVARSLVANARRQREFDFLAAVAVPLTVTMIAELIGWPEAERHRLRPWSADIVRLYERDSSDEDERAAETAAREFGRMVDVIVAERRGRPRDDVISELAAAEDRGLLRSHDELIASCMLLLNAGHEATVNASGNGLLALLRHPVQLDSLRADSKLMPGAIEEMLRYESPLHMFHRYVLEDFSFAGVSLKRGETVGLLYGSANRDAGAFDKPDEFDIRRRPNRHLAFGAETHFCLGSQLARLELSTLFRVLLEELPDLALAEREPQYRPGFVFRGLKRLMLITQS